MRSGQEIGTNGPLILGTRLECEVTSLWSQVIGQDSRDCVFGAAMPNWERKTGRNYVQNLHQTPNHPFSIEFRELANAKTETRCEEAWMVDWRDRRRHYKET